MVSKPIERHYKKWSRIFYFSVALWFVSLFMLLSKFFGTVAGNGTRPEFRSYAGELAFFIIVVIFGVFADTMMTKRKEYSLVPQYLHLDQGRSNKRKVVVPDNGVIRSDLH